MKLRVWFLETRPQFLLLSVVLAILGNAIAWYDGVFDWWYAFLAFFGLLLAHISVNVLNDYFDYRSGIDLNTRRTPFSGGSGILPASLLPPRRVLWFGLAALVAAVPIGIYFIIVQGWELLPLLLVAALCVLLYTPVLTRLGVPEWAPGIGLGILPVLGTYFAQTGAYTWPVAIASVPSGLLVCNLLFLNEFPDVPADRKAGRKTLPILIGENRASRVYAVLTILVYLWLVGAVATRQMPPQALLGLLTLPFAVKAIRGSRHWDDMNRLVPALAANVMVVLLTQLLLGVGYLLARGWA